MGKRSAALTFAMALNCIMRKADPEKVADAGESSISPLSVEAPCGRCRSCRKISSDSHPDIIRVQPSGAYIRIDQIRELCNILAMKPYEAEYRVVVIAEAHRMNIEAGNALLKMLEEPPDRTILILTAPTVADMLPTIVSRCRRIRFNPIPTHRIAEELMSLHGMDAESARALSVLSGGSLSKAEELPRKNWINRRKWLIENFNVLIHPGDKAGVLTRLFATASVISLNKDVTLDSLEILKTLYRDILIFNYQPENLLNPDVREKIAAAAGLMAEEEILAAVNAIDKALGRIRSNANPRLVLETLFLKLAKFAEMN